MSTKKFSRSCCTVCAALARGTEYEEGTQPEDIEPALYLLAVRLMESSAMSGEANFWYARARDVLREIVWEIAKGGTKS